MFRDSWVTARERTGRGRYWWEGLAAPDVRRGSSRLAALRIAAFAAIFTALAGLQGCGDNSVEPIGQPGAMTIEPASPTLEVGQRITLSVTADGQPLSPGDAFWSSSNEDVATVSDVGQVTARAPGQARISASVSGRSATSQVTVQTKAVRNVSVTPVAGSVQVGKTLQFKATLTAGDGTVLDDRDVSWSSENTSVATVNSSGVVTGKAAGVSIIRATSEGVTGQAQVTVSAPVDRVVITPSSATLDRGETQQFSAVAYDASDNVLPGHTASWSISPQSVATVNTSGRVTAVAAGTATLTADIDGKKATATVTVRPPGVATVEVTPGEVELRPTETRQLQATARDADGNVLSGREVSWSISPTNVATISDAGLVTAVSPGEATVTATVEGRQATARVVVLVPVVARVEVSRPNNSPLNPDEKRQLTAQAFDPDDKPIGGVSFNWTSTNTSIATVDQNGMVTAMRWPFTATVTIRAAAPNGERGETTITVRGWLGL